MKKCALIIALLAAVLIMLFLSACGKKESSGVQYEIVDGKVVEVGSGGQNAPSASASSSAGDVIFVPGNADIAPAAHVPVQVFSEDEVSVSVSQAGNGDISLISDGQAFSADEDYNSLTADNSAMLEKLRTAMNAATDACRDVYASADKGTNMNVTLSANTVARMVSAIGSAGYSATDSLGNANMSVWEQMDEFGQSAMQSNENTNGIYFTVYTDGHVSGFNLAREAGAWHVYSMSCAWEDDYSTRIYSEGRYAVGKVRYTDKGWLIYSRDTSDFDENQKANTDSYVMIRVKPYDSELRALCERYVSPVGYFENNLFTTDWSTANLGPIDFNSLYAYLFGMYNGTQQLTSYNIRSYYKAVGGTRLYVVPTETFEKTVSAYFSIDPSTLKNISDYSYKYGGYLFLGYNRDYYNVTPRTPKPEVVDAAYNPDGTITMTVDAVNAWYGTDRAFRHTLTVRPGNYGFSYISNTLVQDGGNILPENKLSYMLDVEETKLD